MQIIYSIQKGAQEEQVVCMGQFFQKKGYILVASIDRKKPSNLHATQFFPHYVKNFTLLFYCSSFPVSLSCRMYDPKTHAFVGHIADTETYMFSRAHCRS
jgi:hypothetical protein